MTRRSYSQLCPIARALDLVGERWTLLIIRNLFLGPQRYNDLLDGLPGIPRNLLAARLRELEAAQLVRRRNLSPPAQAVTVYELTEVRRELEPVLVSLARFGGGFLGQESRDWTFHPAYGMLAIRAAFRPEAAKGIRETYEFRIDGETFHIRIDDGTADVGRGPAQDPQLVIACDAGTFMAVGSRALSPRDAVARGRATIDGTSATLAHCCELLGLLDDAAYEAL